MAAARRRSAASSSEPSEPHSADDNQDVFSDEYAESYAESVHAHSIHRNNSEGTSTGSASGAATYSQLRPAISYSRPIVQGQQPSTRGSIRKPGDGVQNDDNEDGIRLRQPTTQSVRTQSGAPMMAQRTTSSASSFSFATVGQQSGTGPSHPYGMYPQGLGVSRSGSVMTAATVRAPSQSLSHRYGPTYPYGLYPQNSAAEAADGAQQSLIPVGFLGLNQIYQRRVGPEGEEQDIIGLDGHTEQLPPYTWYPDDTATKITTGLPLPAIGETDSPSTEDALIDIEMQERQPAPQQPDDLDFEREGGLSLETSASSRSEKSWNEKSWKEKRRTKLCGYLPLWILLVIIITFVIIAVICGGVIGAFIANRQRHGPEVDATTSAQPAVVTTTVTKMIDASPLQTPAVLPMLPHGIHQLTLNPDDAFDSCLVDTKQKPAWSCALTAHTIAVTIDMIGSDYTASLSAFDNISPLNYGTLPPTLNGQYIGYVSDDDNPDRGGAWHFQTLYNKTVIVAETELMSSTKVKRASQGPQLIAGSQPWLCFFNQTFIEGFLYIYDNSTDTSNTTSTMSPTPLTSSTPLVSLVPLTTSTSIASPVSRTSPTPLTSSIPSPSSTILVPQIPAATISVALSSATFPWAAGSPLPNFPNGPSAPLMSFPQNPHSSGMPLQARATNISPSPSSASTNFPHLIKIEERRFPNSPPPYCQKMELLKDGSWATVFDATGSPITIPLTETDPASSTSSVKLMRRKRDGDDEGLSNSCFCEWESS